MMSNSPAEPEYERAKISIWWDIENCAVPKGLKAHVISQNITSALVKLNYCGPLSIYSYGNTNLIPNSVQIALFSTGIDLNHVPSGRKDASDKKILVDMLFWVMENPAPANLMLISGDGDFSDALHRLKMKRYNILLAHPQPASASLVASTKTTWLWTNLLEGCSSLIPCESSPLVDTAQSPRDSEIISEVASEQVLSRQPMDSGSTSSRVSGNTLRGIHVPKPSTQLLQQETRRKKLMNNCSQTSESPWLCKVCNVTCKSFESFTMHLSGKEHGAQWGPKQNLTLSGEPQNMAAAPSDCHEKDVEMKDKIVDAGVEATVNCGLCSEVCPGQTSLDSHPKIAAMAKKHAEKASERSGRESFQDFKENLERDGVAPLNLDCASRDFGLPKEVRDVSLKELGPSKNEIVIENFGGLLKQDLEMKSGDPKYAHAELNEHLEEDMNKKKKKKKKKSTMLEHGAQWVPKQNLTLSGEPENMAAAPSDCHEKDVEMKDKIIDAGVEATAHYGLCSDVCPGQTSLDSHPTNAALVKKQAEKTSERSGREFCQDYKETLESDCVAPLNLDCASRDIKSPKEVRGDILKELEPSQNEIVIENLEGVLKQDLEMKSGEPKDAHAELNEHLEEGMNKKKKKRTKKKSTVTKDGAETYVCSICSVICDHPAVFESHLKGQKHAATIRKHTEALLDVKESQEEIIRDNGHSNEELWFLGGVASENMDCLEKQFKEMTEGCDTSERTVKELCQNFVVESEDKYFPNAESMFTEQSPLEFSSPKEARGFDAIIKKQELSRTRELESIPNQNLERNSGNADSNSEEYMDHKKNGEAIKDEEARDAILKELEPSQNEIVIENLEGVLKQDLEMKSGEPKDAHAELNEHLEEGMNKKKKKKRTKKKSTVIKDGAETYVCSICSVICDHPAVFESHLMGQKHTATIRKHTEALLDVKEIQEEIIRGNGHSIEEFWFLPGDASENMDCLEKQYKETRDGCYTFERSVDNYFPKAESMFTEQSPHEFSSRNEARECFDAIIKKQELSRTRELESIPNQNLERNSRNAESNSEEYMDYKKKGKAIKDKDEGEASCIIC